MKQYQGVTASPSDSHASHEAASASSPSVSIPNADERFFDDHWRILSMGAHSAGDDWAVRYLAEHFAPRADLEASVKAGWRLTQKLAHAQITLECIGEPATVPPPDASVCGIMARTALKRIRAASAMSAGTAETPKVAQGDSPPARPEGDAQTEPVQP